eukprot:scaffold19916_cov93-Isochrysis_galbana.AAC.3
MARLRPTERQTSMARQKRGSSIGLPSPSCRGLPNRRPRRARKVATASPHPMAATGADPLPRQTRPSGMAERGSLLVRKESERKARTNWSATCPPHTMAQP